jgi:lipoprotein-anchoring transpeptidase ErfK/SrfK
MTTRDWILIIALAVLTIFSMTLVPAKPPSMEEVLALAPTLTPTAQATATATPSLTRIPTRTPTSSATPTSTATATPTATATATLTPSPSATPTATPLAFDTRPDLPRYIYIDQDVQRMYVFEQGQLVRDIPCSTGLPQSNTYTEPWSGPVGRYYGTFQSFGVWADEAWYLYQSLGGILIHSLPYTVENGYKVYQDRDALGVRPSSHGCIRIAPEDAEWFTQWNPQGVYTTVTDPYWDKWRALLYPEETEVVPEPTTSAISVPETATQPVSTPEPSIEAEDTPEPGAEAME